MDLHSLAMVNDDPEDGRWDAFVRRDPGADDQFVVAVDTTCLYCRPTCPARRPLRKNVGFLPDAAAAQPPPSGETPRQPRGAGAP